MRQDRGDMKNDRTASKWIVRILDAHLVGFERRSGSSVRTEAPSALSHSTSTASEIDSARRGTFNSVAWLNGLPSGVLRVSRPLAQNPVLRSHTRAR